MAKKRKTIRTRKNPKRRTRTKRALTPLQAKYFAKGRPQPAFKKRKRKTKITRVRRNPSRAGYVIKACLAKNRYKFFRNSTQSFVDSLNEATAYKSKPLAERTARSLLNRLPGSVTALAVDRL